MTEGSCCDGGEGGGGVVTALASVIGRPDVGDLQAAAQDEQRQLVTTPVSLVAPASPPRRST